MWSHSKVLTSSLRVIVTSKASHEKRVFDRSSKYSVSFTGSSHCIYDHLLMGWQSIKYIADWPVQCLCDTHVEYNLYWMEDDEEVGKDHWKRLNWRRPTKTSKNSLVQTHSQFHSYEYSRVLVVKVRCNITNNNGGKKCNHMYRCIHCAAVAHWDLVFNRLLVWTVANRDRGSFSASVLLWFFWYLNSTETVLAQRK